MRARIEAMFGCDHDLLEGEERCQEQTQGYLVLCVGTVREGATILTQLVEARSEVTVLQPIQIGVRNPAWAVIVRKGTTYVLCPKHAAAGRDALAKRAG